MRFVALFAVVIFALPIAGCSLAIRSQGIEATDLSAIVVGADRETVEGVLGSTIDRVETETGRIDTYRYDRGRAPDAARASSSGWSGSGGGGPGAGYALTLLALGYLIAQPVLIHNLYEEQKGELSITYGADDTVVRIENARQRNQRELREDLSAVLIGATRGQVEELLGAPESSGEDGQVHEYRHQRGDAKDVVYVTYGPEGAVANAETAEQRHARHQRELREDLSVIRIGATREQVEAVLGVSESGSDAAIQQYLHRWGSAHRSQIQLDFQNEKAGRHRSPRSNPMPVMNNCG